MNKPQITTHIGGSGVKWPAHGPLSPEEKKKREQQKGQ